MFITAALFCAIAVIAASGLEVEMSFRDYSGYYKELGCRPVFEKKSSKCPVRFDCPVGIHSRKTDVCYYKNKEYAKSQAIPEADIEHPCSVNCICIDGVDGRAELTCAQVECPEFDGPPAERSKVVQQYEIGECCSNKEITDPAEIEKLKTCKVDDIIYREGERFYPDDTCKECTCTKDYDGTLNGTWCNEINCGLEIYQGPEIHDRCAPVFYQNRNCCPIKWICPQPNDKVIRRASPKDTNSRLKCSYGHMKLNVGDKVTGEDKCITCSCAIPPMLTCVQAKDCY